MNDEKGQPVFSDNVDELLAKKIVRNTKKNTGDAKPRKKVVDEPVKTGEATFTHSAEALGPSAAGCYTYRTPEHKHRVRGLTKYGLAALVLLGLLGILTFLLSKFRKD
jgi:hypothetical protein